MSRRAQGITFGIVTAIWALVLPLAGFMAVMSVMMSDAGVNKAVENAILLAFGWPVSIVLFVAGGWVAYGFKRPVAAALLFAGPIVYFVLMLVGVSILLEHGPRSAQPWG